MRYFRSLLFLFCLTIIVGCSWEKGKKDSFFVNESIQGCFDAFIDSTETKQLKDTTMYLVAITSFNSDTLVSFIYSSYPLVLSIEGTTDYQYAYHYRNHIVSVFSSHLDDSPSFGIAKDSDSLLMQRMIHDAHFIKTGTSLKGSIARFLFKDHGLDTYHCNPSEPILNMYMEEDDVFLDDSFPL